MNSSFHRPARLAAGAFLVAAVLSVGSPATAFPGQGSCGDAAQAYTVPLAQTGEFGHIVSAAGREGIVGDISEELHAIGCPR